jgi:hypothetical protein
MIKIPKISLKRAIQKADNLAIEEKTVIFDKIHLEQPNILASVLVQQQLGNSLEQIEVLLNILLVCHLALNEAGINIIQVTEKEQEVNLEMLINNIKNSSSHQSKAIQKYINSNSEKLLLAYAFDVMNKAGLMNLQNESSKYLVMAGFNIVNCIASAKPVQHFATPDIHCTP